MGDIYINAESMQKRAYKMRFAMRITERELALINYVLTTASKANTLEIVRCGECKRCEERTTLNGLPFLYCLKMEVSVGSDQYCYWGERRNDE